MENKDVDADIELLLEAIFQNYGYDFRNYSRSHIKRRILNRIKIDDLKSVSHLHQLIIQDKNYIIRLLNEFSVNVTEMFRDPLFFSTLRKEVIPILKTYPFVKIWHAGCSTGEEVYSMAILLKEEGLYENARIFATDFNERVLDIAREGIYSNEKIKEYTANYHLSGGVQDFSNYYNSGYGAIIIDEKVKKNIVWANHNLVTDWVFNEMNLIICRNVLIYFTRGLQQKVLNLFDESLIGNGIICLGLKETLKFNDIYHHYVTINDTYTIYQKKIFNSI